MIKLLPILLPCLFLWTGSTALFAQLDTIHWMPPMFPSSTMGTQYIYVYTPEATPFPIVIEDGSGQVVKTATISSTEPFIYELSNTFSQLLVADIYLNQVLPKSGLVILGPKKFHASFRLLTAGGGDACFLTYKGRAALGKTFRIGTLAQAYDKTGQRFNTVGIMATEDGTTINFSDYLPIMNGIPPTPITMQLQRGESLVMVYKIPGIEDPQPKNGFFGALLEATKPIAVTCGGWLGAPVVYEANDIGVDQILPLERVGKEYIFCKGDGPTTLEHPIIIAHLDNTEVWINGADTAFATLNAGQFLSLPSYHYLPAGNIFVRTTEPVFAYQMTGGWDTGKTSLNTPSLMFIPPLSCGIPHRIDNIYLPNRIGPQRFDGSLMIVALRNASVNVLFDGIPVDIGPPIHVQGNDDFVTYKAKRIFSHVDAITKMEISSSGAVYASIIGRHEYASYASLLTGYEYLRPDVHLTLHGDGICPDTLTAHGFFDKIKWVYDDTILQEGTDTVFIVKAPGNYTAFAYLGGCRNTALTADSLDVPLAAPQFDFSFTEPSCYNYPDGQIVFGLPNGGTPPYLYSIDHGQHQSTDPTIDNITGGDYRLIVLDVSGCYNEPVHFTLNQPDSVYVHLVAMKLPKPLRPGDEVILHGFTTNLITATVWVPADASDCPDCMLYYFNPDSTVWVKLTVFDEGGCAGTGSLLVTVEPPVYAPNIINLNSTVGNDRFILYTEKPSLVHQLLIFDRWGNQVFEKRNFFTNSAVDGWDGQHRGKDAKDSVFTFFAKVEVAVGLIVMVRGGLVVAR